MNSKMAFTGKVLQFADDTGLPKEFRDWFVKVGVVEYEDVALACTLESEVALALNAQMKADGVADAESLRGKIAMKKFWIACRGAYDEGKKVKEDNTAVIEAPIGQRESTLIAAAWVKIHGFILPDSQMLVQTTQGRMWRDATADTPCISVWLAEQLRTRSCVNKKTGIMMALQAGKQMEVLDVIADSIDKSFELFVRARAFFMTLAYVSIMNPAWFPLQIAIQATDEILKFISATYSGRVPPVDFLVTAWAHTVHFFSEQIRIQNKTAAEVVGNFGAWSQKWTWTPPSASSGRAVSNGNATPSGEADNEDLRNQIKSMKGQVRRFQEERKRTGYLDQGGESAHKETGFNLSGMHGGSGGKGGKGGSGGNGGGKGGKGGQGGNKKRRRGAKQI